MELHFATSISLIALGQRPALYLHTQTQTPSLSHTLTHTAGRSETISIGWLS